ncbi:MAG: hypothetical protein WD423_00865 [Rhodothermales bacterium]
MNSIGERNVTRGRRRVFTCGLAVGVAALLLASVWTVDALAQNGSSAAPEVRGLRYVDTGRSTSRSTPPLRRPAAASYDVVALRVEFQADTTRFTTGDGTFSGDLYGGLEPSVDPLPHDASYFQAHLDFLEHYVARVSDGRTVVRTHLIPDVVTLPKKMGEYAPTGEASDSDAERAKLARLIFDAWTQADGESDFDMSGFSPDRTAFVLFHAGVGRDVELIGTTLDKTPEDLPSIYFGAETLARLGAAGARFNGMPVGHSMIVPRTETRLGTDFIADRPFLLELSINGMLAASFFNYLGVPDLFDVTTGRSAIGPFGLMDAQGIFAYAGLFPPEPMAWTKYYLGWTDPVDLGGNGPDTLHLSAASLPDASATARALVSDAEYFMIENRYRDPEGDGLTIQVWKDGAVTVQHVENGDETFNGSVISGFSGGVVVGVDNYDWALPGGLDADDNVLNGGILVWHVDERRMRLGLAENAVNTGARRAVDLEEADGAQDIGMPSDNPFAPRADLGTPFDFFYAGNPVVVETPGGREIRLYENRFGPSTYPSSETNAGGPSFVVLEDFSEPGAEMSFVYRLEGESGIVPVQSDSLDALQELLRAAGTGLGPASSIVEAGGATVVYDPVRETAFVSGTPAAAYPSLTHPVVDEALVHLHRVQGSGTALSAVDLKTHDTEWTTPLPGDVDGMRPVSPLVRTRAGGSDTFHVILEGGGRRSLVSVSASDVLVRSTGSTGAPQQLAVVGGDPLLVVGATGAGYPGEDPLWTYDPIEASGRPAFGMESGGLLGVVPIPLEDRLRLLLPEGQVLDVDVRAAAHRLGREAGGDLSSFPVLTDLDGDGRLDVLVAHGPELFAFTQSGAVVENFPVGVGAPQIGQPLLVRRSGSDAPAILVGAVDGYLYGFDADGRRLAGFPLEVGDVVSSTPFAGARRIAAVSGSGTVKAWRWEYGEDAEWGQLFRDPGHSSFSVWSAPDEPAAYESLIDRRETYNWPNPIQDGLTHLRIRTRESARVEITIVDGGGSLVEEMDMGVVDGGVPTETVWQSSGAQSGLYFARFTATTSKGDRETMLVKMAVIR